MMKGTVKANQSAERTGFDGCLTGAQYDIYCPDINANYLSSSCDIRLDNGTCKFGHDCPRYKGKRQKERINKARTKRGKSDKERNVKPKHSKATKVRPCVCCGETKHIVARGLCNRCTGYHRYNNTIKQFPKARQVGATRSL